MSMPDPPVSPLLRLLAAIDCAIEPPLAGAATAAADAAAVAMLL